MTTTICVRCRQKFNIEFIGVPVLEIVDGKTINVYSGDVFKCPGCGFEIIKDMGSEPFLTFLDKDFDTLIKGIKYEVRS